MKKIYYRNPLVTACLLLLVILFSGLVFQACDEDESEGAVPAINYIRVTDPEKSDSLVVRAFLGSTIAIVGEDLQDIKELWFNNQQAKLNTSFITSTSIIVTIPDDIPTVVTDSMTLITKSGVKVKYPFGIDVPPPMVSSMLCEHVAAGETAVIQGNFFIDDPNKPLKVFFPGNIEGEVQSISINEVKVKVPEGAGVGQISVTSLYGSGRSSFFFRDDRNYLLDFDNLFANGWRKGVVGHSDVAPINGDYVIFNGDMLGGNGKTWNEDAFSFNLWGPPTSDYPVPFYSGDLDKMALKFECYVVEPWKASALQMIFTPTSTTGTNAYISNSAVPRGLWRPWTTDSKKTYQTSGWTTVTVPLSNFTYTFDGNTCANPLTNDMLGGLTFFVWNGGVDGEDCKVHMCIDNIRIVPL
jgi:hypothetical protein